MLTLVRPLSLKETELSLPLEAEPIPSTFPISVTTVLSPSAILVLTICDEPLGTSKEIARLGKACDGVSPIGNSGINIIFTSDR